MVAQFRDALTLGQARLVSRTSSTGATPETTVRINQSMRRGASPDIRPRDFGKPAFPAPLLAGTYFSAFSVGRVSLSARPLPGLLSPLRSPTMAPLADFLLAHVPLPSLPAYLTHYVPGQTPLSTQKEVLSALVTYLAVVFGIREVMKGRQPIRATAAFQLHNVILTLGSGLLLVLMVEEIAPILWKGGLFHAMCDDQAWTSVSLDASLSAFDALVMFTRSSGFPPEIGVLLYDQLLLQVPRAH